MTLAVDTPVRVRMGRGAEREATIVEDRGSRYRVRYEDGSTDTVLHERVRAINVRKTVMLPPRLEAVPDLATYATVREASPLRAVPKPPKRWESDDYLAFIRAQDDCACCGSPAHRNDPMEASHHGPRGMSRKSDDSRAIPLRRSCHRYYHDHGVFRGYPSDEPMTREQTDYVARTTAAELLVAYAMREGLHDTIVDALTGALRERER